MYEVKNTWIHSADKPAIQWGISHIVGLWVCFVNEWTAQWRQKLSQWSECSPDEPFLNSRQEESGYVSGTWKWKPNVFSFSVQESLNPSRSHAVFRQKLRKGTFWGTIGTRAPGVKILILKWQKFRFSVWTSDRPTNLKGSRLSVCQKSSHFLMAEANTQSLLSWWLCHLCRIVNSSCLGLFVKTEALKPWIWSLLFPVCSLLRFFRLHKRLWKVLESSWLIRLIFERFFCWICFWVLNTHRLFRTTLRSRLEQDNRAKSDYFKVLDLLRVFSLNSGNHKVKSANFVFQSVLKGGWKHSFGLGLCVCLECNLKAHSLINASHALSWHNCAIETWEITPTKRRVFSIFFFLLSPGVLEKL